ncbi:MAG: C40 family peptidase [Candidatus Zixiibacteriota bacterium]|nr:MAG: C40 family peptidase [candidate division Zixibacteria bacterium]
MPYAFVTTSVLDLWDRAQLNSERVNQALFGEVVEVLGTGRAFTKISKSDGYTGWVYSNFLRSVTRGKAVTYNRRLNHIVTHRAARLLASTGRPVDPYLVYYGTRVWVSSQPSDLSRIVLPDGSVGYVKSGVIRPMNKARSSLVTGSMLVNEARRFLGTPYLWGGLTPAGFDCSGLVQAVCARYGLEIPRDTREQIQAGFNVNRQEVKTGDLLFFKRHVGFALSRDRIVHSSAARGGVRVESLTPGTRAYREDLDKSYVTARRIV